MPKLRLIKKILIAVFLAGFCFVNLSFVVWADEAYDKAEQTYNELNEEIILEEGKIDEAQLDLDEALEDLENLKGDNDAATKQHYLDYVQAMTEKLEEVKTEVKAKVDELKAQADAVKEYMSAAEGKLNTGETILPKTTESVASCEAIMTYVAAHRKDVKQKLFIDRPDNGLLVSMPIGQGLEDKALFIQDVLGCGIKTGNISLWMIPYFVRYILEFALNIAGVVAIGGIIYGGYLYLFAGVSEDKEKGKKAIMYGVAGFVMTLIAWAVVNIMISFFTI